MNIAITRRLSLQTAFLLIGVATPAGLHPRPACAVGPEPILLWPDGAPGAVGTEDADRPAIRIYSPNPGAANGAAIVVCPGGGYGSLATDHEGHQVAKWLNTVGVTGVVLKYRLGPRYRHPAPLQDVQRALRHVRAHAADFNVDPQRVGVMGFSAGGHLAATVSTHFDRGRADSDDPLERQSCRPDFSVLCYPVISFTAPFAHRGSARNLLGEAPDEEALKLLSNETQVTAETPPAFLFHTGEDAGVPVQNSLVYYQALLEHGVGAELHVYQHGPHGVGLGIGDPALYTWKDRLADWLRSNGFLAAVERAEVNGTVTVNGEPLRWGTITFLPDGGDAVPIGWGMVSRGKYAVPAHRGAAVGRNHVIIRNWGDVVPQPTIDDVTRLTRDGADGRSEIVFDVKAGRNTLDADLKR
jgi:acetyl esterase/lipase